MHKQTQPIPCSLPPSNQDSKKPSMACQQAGAQAQPTLTGRSSGGADDDFEFCILSSGGLAPAGGDDTADMCVADEVFAGGKLLPLRLSSAASADASALLRLLRSDSLDGAATASSTTTTSSGFSSRSVSRSSSSGGGVSRSTSSNSNSASSSDHAGSSSSSSSSKNASSAAAAPLRLPRRSLSGSVFYAHPSPSPRPPPRRSAAKPAAGRRSTGSAPPASWGVIRLGVVGAPEVYAPRPAASRSGSGSGSARFEQHRAADKKQLGLGVGLLGAGLVCSCSPDAVAPVGSAEVAAAEARRRRKKKAAAEEKKKRSSATAEQSGKATARRSRSRILDWLEDLSVSKKSAEIIVS